MLLVVQVAFVGHDAGHNAVAHNSKYDGYIGLLVNACIGIGPSWWKVPSPVLTVVPACAPHLSSLQLGCLRDSLYCCESPADVCSQSHDRIVPVPHPPSV